MANIVGEQFDKYVLKQISDRQIIHGQGINSVRDNNTLAYLNSKTPWIKLSSGVSIQDINRLNQIGLGGHPSFLGPDSENNNRTGLSNFFVLFNGTSDNSGTQFGGIDFQLNQKDIGQSILNKVAYGIGGNKFGLRPMPGITSCETKFRNRGSIREGTIIIKAWNRSQLEIISLLYMRLGFPMLLEWGHSIIVDDKGNINTKPNFSISKEFLGLKYKTDNQVLEALESKRIESAGNYDGMYGRVINFDWTFNKDGSYDITLKLISIGGVIESLKANVYIKDEKNKSEDKATDNKTEEPTTDQDWITAYKYSHYIGNCFFQFYKAVHNKPQDRGMRFTSIEDLVFIRGGTSKDFVFITGLNKYYIRFGAFWSLLQQIVPVKKSSPTDEEIPLVYFEPSGLEKNPMYTEEFQLSSDPRVCLVGGFGIINDYEFPKNTYSILPALNNFKDTSDINSMKGKSENIYINTTLILQKLNDNKDENGDVKLYDFIQSIIDSINVALGGVNKLSLIIDENTNRAKIIDETPIPNYPITNEAQNNIPPTFNFFGYLNNKTTAGFIKDFSLKTEITNNLSALLTIGATANKSVVGEDATAFSKWNKGLVPIIGQQVSYPGEKSSKSEPVSKLKQNFQLENQQLLDQCKKWLNMQTLKGPNNSKLNNPTEVSGVFKDVDPDEFDNYSDIVKNFINFNKNHKLVGKKDTSTSTSSRGFLPVNLSLTMDGLSGIKIYQQIKVDTTTLPQEYPTVLKFIIKGVTNRINNTNWTTSLETVSIPVIDSLNENVSGLTTDDKSTKLPPSSVNRAESRNNVNAENLRKTITQLGYSEKGKEIDNSGNDISSEIEKAASSVLKTIKKELPNVKVTITGGNDNYHQNLSYDSRHKKGNAIDLTVSPSDKTTLDKVVTILQRYAAGNSPNFRFIDEYRHLTDAGTGNHFHLSWGAGTEAQSTSIEAVKLAKEGKIQPILIV